MANPVGTLVGPLAFRFLDSGPDGPLGEAGLERFLAATAAVVAWGWWLSENSGPRKDTDWRFKAGRSGVDWDTWTGASGLSEFEIAVATAAVGYAADGCTGVPSRGLTGPPGTWGGVCVLWSSVIMMESENVWATIRS